MEATPYWLSIYTFVFPWQILYKKMWMKDWLKNLLKIGLELTSNKTNIIPQNFNYITIHISAGIEALKAVKKVSGKVKIIGVTTLTSLNNNSLKEIGYNKNIASLVVHQAKLASKARLDGIVCSAQEAKSVKKFLKKKL